MLKMKEKIMFSPTVQPVPIIMLEEEELNNITYSNCKVIGWSKKTVKTYELILDTVELLATEACENILTKRFFHMGDESEYQVWSNQICTSDTYDVQGHCPSGAVLICNDYLIGILSWGPNCPNYEKSIPIIFSRLKKFVDFINYTMGFTWNAKHYFNMSNTTFLLSPYHIIYLLLIQYFFLIIDF